MRLTVLTTLLLWWSFAVAVKDPNPKKQEISATKLAPCAACEALVNSFDLGLERTSRGKFEGGDTAWKEKNQVRGYSNSEVRFVEIQEELCKDVKKGKRLLYILQGPMRLIAVI